MRAGAKGTSMASISPSLLPPPPRSYAIGNAEVVLLAGARLNWLLSHGRPPLWSEGTRFVQVDISPTEIDSNRAIARRSSATSSRSSPRSTPG
jgi:thiamine pyrophosphate-dependent acetolactate synthase large subunit-like protein